MSDSDFELADHVFGSLVEREERDGPEGINDLERVVLLVWHSSGIIDNGGFRRFFECGLPLGATTRAYARLGVQPAAESLQALTDLLAIRADLADLDSCREALAGIYEEQPEVMGRLERAFWDADELTERQVAGWIRVHADIFHATMPPNPALERTPTGDGAGPGSNVYLRQ